MWTDLAGYLAAIASTCVLIPQIIRMYRTKEVEDVSVYMLFLTIIAQILWIIYGYLRGDFILFISSVVALVFGIISVIFWYSYRKFPVKQLVLAGRI